MNDNFLGEIRYVAFNFPPQGWALCAGQTLSISQNTALFSLLGTNYGGNGTTNFALPDLQGRISISEGQGPGLQQYSVGQTGGVESHALAVSELPAHSHDVAASTNVATATDPTTGVFAKPSLPRGGNLYSATAGAAAAADTIGVTGNAAAHENRAPGLAMTAIIALQGIYPPRP